MAIRNFLKRWSNNRSVSDTRRWAARQLEVEQLEDRLLLTSFFVSPAGVDTNPGTLASPLGTINAAMELAQPGDEVMLRAGTYRETISSVRSGLPGAPITVESYNGEEVYISASDEVDGPWTETTPGSGIYSTPTTGSLPAIFWTGSNPQPNGNGIVEQSGEITVTVVNTSTFSTTLTRSVNASDAWNFFDEAKTWQVRGLSIESTGATPLPLDKASGRFSVMASTSGYGADDGLTVEYFGDGRVTLRTKTDTPNSWGTSVGSVTNTAIDGFDLTLGPGTPGNVAYTLTAVPTNQVVATGEWAITQNDWSDGGDGSTSYVQIFAQEGVSPAVDPDQRFELQVGSYEIISSSGAVLTDYFDDGELTSVNSFPSGNASGITSGVDQIFVDGEMQNEARHANRISTNVLMQDTVTVTVQDDYTITSPTFGGKPNDFYAGGRFVGRVGQGWAWQTAEIIASSGNTLTVDASSVSTWWWPNFANKTSDTGLGYVYGKLDFLDADREWHLQKSASGPSTLYLRADGGANPDDHLVEQKVRNWTVDLNQHNHIVVRGLNLRGGAVRMDGTGLVLEDSDARYLSHFQKFTNGYSVSGDGAHGSGVALNGTGNIVRNNSIYDTAGSGVVANGSSHLITNNHIHHVDYSGTYATGISLNGTGHTATYNTIHDAGRDIVRPTGAGLTIMFNDLYRAGLLAHDVGVMYTWGKDGLDPATGNKTRIAYNWVHEKGDPTDHISTGIYLDNFTRNYILDHNVIWGFADADPESGIKLNAPLEGVEIYHNTLIGSPPDNVTRTTFSSFPGSSPNGTWTQANHGMEYIAQNNLYIPATADLTTIFRNYDQRDFRLKPATGAIDPSTVTGLDQWNSPDGTANVPADFRLNMVTRPQSFFYEEITGHGVTLAGINDGFLGATPDDGAYESGVNDYWIPGRQSNAASVPGPRHNAYEQPLDVDLTYLPGALGVTADIYFGTDASQVGAANTSSAEFLTTQTDPTNIVNLSAFGQTLTASSEYFWRVDTRLAGGTVIPGQVWRFATESGQPLVVINDNGATNITTTSATVGGEIIAAGQVTLLDDTFDDGNIGTNSNGLGTGFNQLGNVNASENAAASAYQIGDAAGGFTQRAITSKDEFAFTNQPLEFSWTARNFSVTDGPEPEELHLDFVVVSDDEDATNSSIHHWNIDQGGFWLVLTAKVVSGDTLIEGTLFASDDSNTANSQANSDGLTSFSFIHQNGDDISAKLVLNRVNGTQRFSYDLAVENPGGLVHSASGETDDTIVATDFLADELAGGVWTGVHVGNRWGGTGSIDIDQVKVRSGATVNAEIEYWEQGQASNTIDLGVQPGAFSTTLTGLDPNTTYFYRAHASDGVNNASAIGTRSFTTLAIPAVAGRHIAYGGSTHGDTAASDKQALLPGETSGVGHFSSYVFGLNRVLIDIDALPGGLSATLGNIDDFEFRVGNIDDVSQWLVLDESSSIPLPNISVTAGPTGSSSRVMLAWPNNAIANGWLQVTVKATANTGLSADDVFYFGNQVGDVNGDVNIDNRIRVNSFDTGLVRLNQSPVTTVGMENVYDVDRNGLVNSFDTGRVRLNQSLGGLLMFTAPPGSPPSAPSAPLVFAPEVQPSAVIAPTTIRTSQRSYLDRLITRWNNNFREDLSAERRRELTLRRLKGVAARFAAAGDSFASVGELAKAKRRTEMALILNSIVQEIESDADTTPDAVFANWTNAN